MLKIMFLLLALNSFNLYAIEGKDRLSITPIVGLERVQKFQPSPHMKTRAIFGARAIFALPISSLEAEYTHAQDTSDDTATSTSYKDVEDKLRLGLRGSSNTAGFINFYLRGGAQVRKNEQTKTVSTTTTTKDTTTKVQPYVGTGIDIRILQYFSLSADILATYTPTSDANLKDYELQPSLGINFRF